MALNCSPEQPVKQEYSRYFTNAGKENDTGNVGS